MFFETEKTKTTKFCKIVAIYLFFWGSSVFLVFLFVCFSNTSISILCF